MVKHFCLVILSALFPLFASAAYSPGTYLTNESGTYLDPRARTWTLGVADAVTVSNFPTSFSVSNFPLSFNVGNFPSSFSVSNFPATQDVAGTVGVSGSVAVTGNFWQATQPVSIASSVPVTGAFYQTTQPVSIASSVPVTGAFYQATQPVSIASSVPVTGTFFQATQPVSATALPLPTGAATAAAQTTGNASLSSIDSKLTSPLNVNVVSSSLGGSTAANQTTGNASLSSIDSKLTSPLNVNVVSSSLGGATAAKQDTGNSSLASIDTKVATETTLSAINAKLPGLGQQTMALSQPVTIASDQSGIATKDFGLLISGQSAAALNADIVPQTDVSMFAHASVHITGTFVGTLVPQCTNESSPVNWIAVNLQTAANGLNQPAQSTTTGGIFNVPLACKWFRMRFTAYTSGTAVGNTEFSSMPPQMVGQQSVSVAGTIQLGAGSSTIGNIQASANLIGDVGVQYRANATGAALRYHLISAATTNAALVKAAAGRLIGWSIANTNSTAWRYVKIHNLATAPTVGTTPVVQTIAIPPNGLAQNHLEGGLAHTTGISVSVTGAVGDADTTAVAAGDVVVDLFYQ